MADASNISTAAGLDAAIQAANGANAATNQIDLVAGAVVALTQPLTAIKPRTYASVAIGGAGATLDGQGVAPGLEVGGGFVTITDLSVVNTTGAGLTVVSGGVATLSGSNAFSGGIDVNGGALVVSSQSAVGAGAIGIEAGGALSFAADNPLEKGR